MCKLEGYNVFGKRSDRSDRSVVSWLIESVNLTALLQFPSDWWLHNWHAKSNWSVHSVLTFTVMSMVIKRLNDCEHWFPLVSHQAERERKLCLAGKAFARFFVGKKEYYIEISARCLWICLHKFSNTSFTVFACSKQKIKRKQENTSFNKTRHITRENWQFKFFVRKITGLFSVNKGRKRLQIIEFSQREAGSIHVELTISTGFSTVMHSWPSPKFLLTIRPHACYAAGISS